MPQARNNIMSAPTMREIYYKDSPNTPTISNHFVLNEQTIITSLIIQQTSQLPTSLTGGQARNTHNPQPSTKKSCSSSSIDNFTSIDYCIEVKYIKVVQRISINSLHNLSILTYAIATLYLKKEHYWNRAREEQNGRYI